MTKHTIELQKEGIKIVKVVQAVKEFTNIDKTIAFIIKDYADSNSYSKFIKEHEGKKQ
jgi:hypothetical protein